jgi:Dolichyl-phosphate-mannose-protein mannosyltransferase
MVPRVRHNWQWFVVLLAFAAILRTALVIQPGLWADEIFSLAIATGHSLEHPPGEANPFLGDFVEPPEAQEPEAFQRYLKHESPPAGVGRVIRAVLLSDTNPPLYYLLLNHWTRATGTGDTALHLFSMIWALLCFPLLWLLGRQMGGTKTAWTGCLLFTFAPRALYYSAEGRMYSLVWFLGLSLAWLTLKLARTGFRAHLFLLWILSGAAGLLTHYFFVFVWSACSVWLWIHPGKLRRSHLLASFVLTALIVLPWYLQLPDSLGRWRVTGNWLSGALSWPQLLAAPFFLAWSLLSGGGPWGGSWWADAFAAGLYAGLILIVARRGLRPLFLRRRTLLWFWMLAVTVGPILFDLLLHTQASTIGRYALSGLPAAMLLAGFGMSRLAPKAHVVCLVLVLLAWLPGIRGIFTAPTRPWEPFLEVAARLDAWGGPSDVIVVHSIPSGVLGLARYLQKKTDLASWIVQLKQRRAGDLDGLLPGRCRVALVKIHDMGEASPAEAALTARATLEDREVFPPFTEILYFALNSSGDRSVNRCSALSKPTSSGAGMLPPSASNSAD